MARIIVSSKLYENDNDDESNESDQSSEEMEEKGRKEAEKEEKAVNRKDEDGRTVLHLATLDGEL